MKSFKKILLSIFKRKEVVEMPFTKKKKPTVKDREKDKDAKDKVVVAAKKKKK